MERIPLNPTPPDWERLAVLPRRLYLPPRAVLPRLLYLPTRMVLPRRTYLRDVLCFLLELLPRLLPAGLCLNAAII